MKRPYRPSNGTEGEAFAERYCYRCARYETLENPDDGGCSIWFASFAFEVEDERYPKEWTIEDTDISTASCSAFIAEGQPTERLCPRCNGLGLTPSPTKILDGTLPDERCQECNGRGIVPL